MNGFTFRMLFAGLCGFVEERDAEGRLVAMNALLAKVPQPLVVSAPLPGGKRPKHVPHTARLVVRTADYDSVNSTRKPSGTKGNITFWNLDGAEIEIRHGDDTADADKTLHIVDGTGTDSDFSLIPYFNDDARRDCVDSMDLNAAGLAARLRATIGTIECEPTSVTVLPFKFVPLSTISSGGPADLIRRAWLEKRVATLPVYKRVFAAEDDFSESPTSVVIMLGPKPKEDAIVLRPALGRSLDVVVRNEPGTEIDPGEKPESFFGPDIDKAFVDIDYELNDLLTPNGLGPNVLVPAKSLGRVLPGDTGSAQPCGGKRLNAQRPKTIKPKAAKPRRSAKKSSATKKRKSK